MHNLKFCLSSLLYLRTNLHVINCVAQAQHSLHLQYWRRLAWHFARRQLHVSIKVDGRPLSSFIPNDRADTNYAIIHCCSVLHAFDLALVYPCVLLHCTHLNVYLHRCEHLCTLYAQYAQYAQVFTVHF